MTVGIAADLALLLQLRDLSQVRRGTPANSATERRIYCCKY